MIDKQGKLFIDNKLHKNRFDKNECYGYEGYINGKNIVSFFEIIREWLIGNIKITISKKRVLEVQKDFMRIEFDPPEANSGEKESA